MMMTGCSNSKPKISQEEAKDMILKRYKHAHTYQIGTIKIKSVERKNGDYIIQWENKENGEIGTDLVDENSGKITTGEYRID